MTDTCAYEISKPEKKHLGRIGISRVADGSQYVMVVEGEKLETYATLIFCDDTIRISNVPHDIFFTPDAVIRPDISKESILFGDATTPIGLIRFVDGRALLIVKSGEDEKLVDIHSGKTEGNNGYGHPMAKKWSITRPDTEGKPRVVFKFPQG
ncbi:hypothetical protein [Mesorhizobium sp. A623]